MTIEELQALFDSGQFHHATYRNRGTIWEGLWIYSMDPNGFRGFLVRGVFHPDNSDYDKAETLCRNTGISVGCYGQG